MTPPRKNIFELLNKVTDMNARILDIIDYALQTAETNDVNQISFQIDNYVLDLSQYEGDLIMGNKDVGDNIEVKIEGSSISGNFVVGKNIKDNLIMISNSEMDKSLQGYMEELCILVEGMTKSISSEEKDEAVDNLKKLVEEASKPKPRKKWWSISIEGLLNAAKKIGEAGKPIIETIMAIVPLLDKISI